MAYFDRKDDYGYIRWAQDVKRRDHYVCHVCASKGVQLNSHHLNSWADHPDQRYDVTNGVCLCSICHEKFHEIYGKGKNTEEQFRQFEKTMSVIIKMANKEGIINSATRRILQQAEKERAVEEIMNDLRENSNKER